MTNFPPCYRLQGLLIIENTMEPVYRQQPYAGEVQFELYSIVLYVQGAAEWD